MASRRGYLAILAILVGPPALSLGALIEADWKVPGDGKAFHDTATGLTWLDPSQTRGMTGYSYNQMVTMFGAGGEFEGWRYATLPEVETVMNSAKLPSIYTTWNYHGDEDAYDDGLAFWSIAGGATAYGGWVLIDGQEYKQYEHIYWITGTESAPGSRLTVNTYLSHAWGTAGYGIRNYAEDSAGYGFGHALVLAVPTPVPEPSSLAMFAGLGVMGLLVCCLR